MYQLKAIYYLQFLLSFYLLFLSSNVNGNTLIVEQDFYIFSQKTHSVFYPTDSPFYKNHKEHPTTEEKSEESEKENIEEEDTKKEPKEKSTLKTFGTAHTSYRYSNTLRPQIELSQSNLGSIFTPCFYPDFRHNHAIIVCYCVFLC